MDARATAEFGVPSLILMEHAARGIAAIAAQLLAGDGVIFVLCGPGNNGGDGYGAARFLHGCGKHVRTWCCAPRMPSKGDAGHQARLLQAEAEVEQAFTAPQRLVEALPLASLVVDALFGVGLTRALEPPYLTWIEALNASKAPCLAVDVPSGLHADTGATLPVCVQADVTATMAAPKRGLRANPGAAGHIVEIDIGLPGPLHTPYAVADRR